MRLLPLGMLARRNGQARSVSGFLLNTRPACVGSNGGFIFEQASASSEDSGAMAVALMTWRWAAGSTVNGLKEEGKGGSRVKGLEMPGSEQVREGGW